MRSYTAVVRELGARELRMLRERMGQTQEEMAERLRITARAYSDLERGKYCASAATLLFLLAMLSAEDQQMLLGQFVECVQRAESSAAQPEPELSYI